MAVTLNGNTLSHIIDTSFVKRSKVSIPYWINQSSEINTNVWSKKPLTIVYTVRVTDALKWTIDQILTGASAITLVDTTYGLNNSVWVSSISATWKGDVNWSKPWNIEITLTIVT